MFIVNLQNILKESFYYVIDGIHRPKTVCTYSIPTSLKYQVRYLDFLQIFKEYRLHENRLRRLNVTAKRPHKTAAISIIGGK